MANFYLLQQGCCRNLNVTLCENHLSQRVATGWKVLQYKGNDSQPCLDCEQSKPTKFEGHKPSVVKSSDPQGQGTAAPKRCCGKNG